MLPCLYPPSASRPAPPPPASKARRTGNDATDLPSSPCAGPPPCDGEVEHGVVMRHGGAHARPWPSLCRPGPPPPAPAQGATELLPISGVKERTTQRSRLARLRLVGCGTRAASAVAAASLSADPSVLEQGRPPWLRTDLPAPAASRLLPGEEAEDAGAPATELHPVSGCEGGHGRRSRPAAPGEDGCQHRRGGLPAGRGEDGCRGEEQAGAGALLSRSPFPCPCPVHGGTARGPPSRGNAQRAYPALASRAVAGGEVHGNGGEVVLHELLGNGSGGGKHQHLVVVEGASASFQVVATRASSLGSAAAGPAVGPREGSRSSSTPLNLEELWGEGKIPLAFP
jgi:hypothetical protein